MITPQTDGQHTNKCTKIEGEEEEQQQQINQLQVSGDALCN